MKIGQITLDGSSVELNEKCPDCKVLLISGDKNIFIGVNVILCLKHSEMVKPESDKYSLSIMWTRDS